MISFQKCTKDEFKNIVLNSKVKAYEYKSDKTLEENIDLFFEDPNNSGLDRNKVQELFEVYFLN